MQRVMNARIYDVLEGAVAVGGGIGADYGWDGENDKPLCIYGYTSMLREELFMSIQRELGSLGILPLDSDQAVYAINKRNNPDNPRARVSFQDWCSELNVVRQEG